MSTWELAVFVAFTSTFAAIVGQGGGLMLMPALAGTIAPSHLIPVHGFIQAVSTGSRAITNWRNVQWTFFVPIFIGCGLGSLAAWPLINVINWQWMQSLIGILIIWLTWSKSIEKYFERLNGKPHSLTVLGVVQGGSGVLVGATGPLGSALLIRLGLKPEAIIATNGLIMFITHILKTGLFLLAGISIWHYGELLIYASAAAILGTLIGNRLRQYIQAKSLTHLLKAVITILAIRMTLLPILNE